MSAASLVPALTGAWLAPLAGWSDLAFRLLCREHGAAACCTEMVSAKGLLYKSPGTKDLLRTTPDDTPLVVQLFGAEADTMTQVMPALLEQGFAYFDLNMGCAVPKVTRTGSGAALLRDIPRAVAIARAMVAVAGLGRVGCKLRLGWDTASLVYEDLALRLQDVGVAWISLHPRTARQGFGGTADWTCIAHLVQRLSIPVIASGDVFSAYDGLRCLRETGAAGIMYARGALHHPAIFEDHKRLLAGLAPAVPTAGSLRALLRRHATLACTHGSERVALLKMRTVAPRYVHHVPGVRLLRQQLAVCRDWSSLEHILDDFLQ